MDDRICNGRLDKHENKWVRYAIEVKIKMIFNSVLEKRQKAKY